MSDIMLCWQQKKFKNWWKSSKKIPKNEIWTRKWMIQNDIWSCLSINFRFSSRFSKPAKTSNKVLSHNNTVAVQEVCSTFKPSVVTGIFDPNRSQARQQHNTVFSQKTSSYKPHLTQQYKNYTPATQLKTLLTLQIFQKTCLWFLSDETLALHHFYAPKNCIFKVLGKQMSIYSCNSP